VKHGGINYERLRSAVRARVAGMTLREAEVESGVSASTLTKFLRGRNGLSRETFTRLVEWIGVPAESFVGNGQRCQPEGATPDKIEWAIYDDPALDENAARVLANLMREAYARAEKPE
jgi:transcriptional regulator with XRE-family HTH domain